VWLLTVRDLQFRRVRFLVVSLGVAVVLTLLYLMTGLVNQFNRESYLLTDQLGASHWLVPDGASGAFTSSSALVPEQVAQLEAPGSSSEVVVSRATLNVDGTDDEAIVIAADGDDLGVPSPVEGTTPQADGEVMVDVRAGAAVGDEVRLDDEPFTVVGITQDTTVIAGLVGVFLPLESARDTLFGGVPVTSAVLLDGVPSSVPDGTQVLTADEVAEDGRESLAQAIASVDLVRALLWAVAAINIGAVIYLSALERGRDFAVLKAIGGRNRQLAGSLALQAVVVALAAAAVASLLQLVIAPQFPLTVRVPASAYLTIPLAAVAVALLAGWAGMRRVTRADPATAFGGAA
jgi:putative ABC transport system permease protein